MAPKNKKQLNNSYRFPIHGEFTIGQISQITDSAKPSKLLFPADETSIPNGISDMFR